MLNDLTVTLTFAVPDIEDIFAEWVRMNYPDFEPLLVIPAIDQDKDRNPGPPYLTSISVKCKRKKKDEKN